MPSVTGFDQTAVPVSADSTTSRGAPQRSSPLHLSKTAQNPTGWGKQGQAAGQS